MRISTLWMGVLLMSAAPGVLVWGQLYQVRVEGQIVDPSGAVVPGASIRAANTETGVMVQGKSTAEGNYVLPPLNPGNYTITVEADGFKKLVREGITVSVGQQIRLDFALEIGSATQQVTVTAEAPLLNVTEPELGQVLTRDYVDKLYVPNRNPINLVSLIAGVGTSGTAAMGSGSARFSESLAVGLTVGGGGSMMGSNEMTVDGLAINVPRERGRETGIPSSDALAEMSVKTTNFDASLGRTNGGTIIMATRSGTNQFHGSFEGFFGDASLNANGWTNNRYGNQRPDVNRRFYSGTVGGPIQKDKTFFFFSLQRETDRGATGQGGRVPTAEERAGDFSKTLNQRGTPLQIYDPFSTVVSGGTATRQIFPNARIPSSRFDPMGAATIKVYPNPNLNVPTQIGLRNYSAVFPLPFEPTSGHCGSTAFWRNGTRSSAGTTRTSITRDATAVRRASSMWLSKPTPPRQPH